MEGYLVGFIVFFVVFALNIGFYIPARVKGYFYSDTLVICMAVFQNVLFAIFVTCIVYIATDFNFGFIFGIVFFIPVTIFSNIIVFLCCKQHTKRRSRFLNFPKMIAGSPSTLKTYIEKAHANPPVLKIDGQYK